MPDTPQPDTINKPFRILALDGGGAKGFYTLGLLDEIERNMGKPLHTCFDLIYGTSTGAIIAALATRGDSVESIIKTYGEHVPAIMKQKDVPARTAALHTHAKAVFGDTTLASFKTRISIVATNWKDEKPFIFKASPSQAHGAHGSFVPFWGVSVTDAIIASCSAAPFFNSHTVTTSKGDVIEVADGGFCANNPTVYAIADVMGPLKCAPADIRVVSLGVGVYPPPSLLKRIGRLRSWSVAKHYFSSDFLQKILDTNTGSMEQLRVILYKNVPTIRISEAYPEPAMATDLLEHDMTKLNRLVQKGRLSYQKHEDAILALLKL